MFSKNRELIPDTVISRNLFALLDTLELTQEDLVTLDENLNAAGMFTIDSVKSTSVMGDLTLAALLATNNGLGTLQFTLIKRMNVIDIQYFPTEVGKQPQKIMRIDISGRDTIEEPIVESESDPVGVVTDEGTTEDDKSGSN
jgi:hypothetical protein